MHDRKFNGCWQRLLFAHQLRQQKCSLCSQGIYAQSRQSPIFLTQGNTYNSLRFLNKYLMFLKELNELFRENCSKFLSAGHLPFWKQFPAAWYHVNMFMCISQPLLKVHGWTKKELLTHYSDFITITPTSRGLSLLCFVGGPNCSREGGIGCWVKLFKMSSGIKSFIPVKNVLSRSKMSLCPPETIISCFNSSLCDFPPSSIGKTQGELGVLTSLFLPREAREVSPGEMWGDSLGFTTVETLMFAFPGLKALLI